jgi:hypothetical protein
MMIPVRSFAGVGDGLVHGHMVPGRAAAVEAHGAAVDHFLGAQGRRPVDLAAEAEAGVVLGPAHARLRLAQRRHNFLRVVADGRDDAHPGDDDAPHGKYAPRGRPNPLR